MNRMAEREEDKQEEVSLFHESVPIPKTFFSLTLPVVLGMMVTLIYNLTDTYFIAKTGNTALVAGVSLCAPIFTMLIALGDIFGLGGSSVLSRLFGEKRYEDAKIVSVLSVYGGILIGVIVLLILVCKQEAILHLLGANIETMPYAKDYYRWLCIGSPLVVVSYTPINHLRSEGMAKESMIGSFIGTAVNVVLDPILILALGWGAAGAAIATVIGNICTVSFFSFLYLKKTKYLSIDIRVLKVKKEDLKNIFSIGIPASFTNLMNSYAVLMMNRSFLIYGNDCIAAYGIASKVIIIASFFLIGFAFGGQPLYGYNFGAKNYVRLKKIMKFSYTFMLSLALFLAIVIEVAAPALILMFHVPKEIQLLAVQILRYQVAGNMFMAVTLLSTCFFQSVGNAVGAFVLSVGRQGVIFTSVLLIARSVLGYQGVLLTQPLVDLLTALLAGILVLGFWAKGEF